MTVVMGLAALAAFFAPLVFLGSLRGPSSAWACGVWAWARKTR